MASEKSDGLEEVGESLEPETGEDLGSFLDKCPDLGDLKSKGNKEMLAGLGVAGSSTFYLFSPVSLRHQLTKVPEKVDIPGTGKSVEVPFNGDFAKRKIDYIESNYIRKDIKSFGEVEGLEDVESYEDFVDQLPEFVEQSPELLGYATDNMAHFASNMGFGLLAGKAANHAFNRSDFFEDGYHRKKVFLACMATAPVYFYAKEGYIEGAADSMNVVWQSMDVRGDAMSDALGGLFSFSLIDEQMNEGKGLYSKMMRKAGRTYGLLEYWKHVPGENSYEEAETGHAVSERLEDIYDLEERGDLELGHVFSEGLEFDDLNEEKEYNDPVKAPLEED